jgi:multidrug efflux pump subunit AcrB
VTRAIAWFAHNPVAANLLMVLLLVAGVTAIPMIQQKTMPDFEMEMIEISVEYLGAAPAEVEEGVCIRIEEEITAVEGIERLSSTAIEGACHVMAELITGYPIDRALTEIKNAVDGIDTFPVEAERPVVSHYASKHNELQIAISGAASERALKFHGEHLRDGIVAMTGVTQAELVNARRDEISIEVSEESLRRHGITFDVVVAAVRGSSLDMPGGSIRTSDGEILLRSKGQAYRGDEFERIVVLKRADGTRVLLRDVARVVDGFVEEPRYARFDGNPSVMIEVYRVGDQKVLEIVAEAKEYVEAFASQLPEGLSVTVWRDGSNYLRDRLSVLIGNGMGGFVLVFVVLALFLRLRLAFWVALGVPVSFMGALALFPPLSVSIDVLTLFAFILVLGVLVDDAIVVGENVHTHQERAEDPVDAAIRGAQEVSKPVIFGVLTTVVAFTPLVLAPGTTGQMFGTIAIVVIACLFFSLIESQLVLPAHLGHHRQRATALSVEATVDPTSIGARWKRVQARMASALSDFAKQRYQPALERALDWRYATAAAALSLLLLVVTVLASGRIPFTFFPTIEGDYITAAVTMPHGTPIEVTEDAVRRLEQGILQVKAELDGEFAHPGGPIVRHILTAVGEHPGSIAGPSESSGEVGSHLGMVAVELLGGNARPIRAPVVVDRWRRATGPIPEAEELNYSSDYTSMGAPIDVELRSPDTAQLARAGDELKAKLATYPGVLDITDSFREGKEEIQLAILPAGEALGLSLEDVAVQVRQAFYGEEAQRVQRGRDDVKVMVRYPESQRRSLLDLENLRIRTPEGGEVPFYSVARAERGRGFASIKRTDRQRVIDVKADVDNERANANQVLADLQKNFLPQLLAAYPGLGYSFEGEQRDQREAGSTLMRSYGFALVVIFALLAVPLRSYAQPVIIMSVIPFGLVGAVAGHLLLGLEFSIMSSFGIVALSGVVVNSSLVLVHYVNQERERGVALLEAVVHGGVARFRPIVLTSLTTFAGLTPMLADNRLGARFLVPMAASLAFGVVFATLIGLFLVPAGYMILEDLVGLRARWLGRREVGDGERERAGPTPGAVGALGESRATGLMNQRAGGPDA